MKQREPRVRINRNIRSETVRMIDENGENKGITSLEDAVVYAEKLNLDVVEASSKTSPPIVKVVDYGKWQYTEKKRARSTDKQKPAGSETKTLQVKVVTGDDAKKTRASQIDTWLKDGQRVKVDLFLSGRYKYMDEAFLKTRLETFVKLIKAEYTIVDEIKKSPKGFSILMQGKKINNDKNNQSSKITDKSDEEQ